MRLQNLLLCILLVVPLVPMAQAQDTVDAALAPWWPVASAKPENLYSSWNLRIPLRVDNPGPTPYAAGRPVLVHLDLGASMIEAGWPAADGTSGPYPRSFTADPELIRLVRYSNQWTTTLEVVPALTFQTWFEPTQDRYHKTQTQEFNSTWNTVVTLEWTLNATLAAGSALYYYAYFDVQQNSDPAAPRPPYLTDPAELERLSGLHWVGPGERLYGHHPGAATATPTLTIVATQAGTTVSVLTHRGAAVPRLDNRAGSGNTVTSPFTMAAGQQVRYSLGGTATNFVIAADKPIVAYTNDANAGVIRPQDYRTGFVPSLDQTMLGTSFLVPQVSNSIRVIAPPDATASIQVVVGANPPQSILPGGEARIPLNSNPESVTSSAPILVQYGPSSTRLIQVPSTHGAPVGERFLGAASRGGGFVASASDGASHLTVRQELYLQPPRIYLQDHLLPGGGSLSVSAENYPVTPLTNQRETAAMTLRRLTDPGLPATELGPLQVQVGDITSLAEPRQTSAFGGKSGMEFLVAGSFVILGQYDATSVDVDAPLEGFREAGIPIDHDGFQEIVLDAATTAKITANKPVAILPLGDPGAYIRFLPARPAFLQPAVLPGEYRGYLVDIRPEGGVEPLFFNGLPGQTIQVPFQVQSLARWNGAALDDTVQLSVQVSPPNWAGTPRFAQTEIGFKNPTPVSSTLDVKLADDLAPDSTGTLRVRATSKANPNMVSEFTAVIHSRQSYGVDLWFGEASSTAGSSTQSARLVLGTSKDIPLVLKNSGTGDDSFALNVGQIGGGWAAQLLRNGQPVGPLTGALEAGEQIGLVLRLRAPQTAETAAITVPIDATSTKSPAAADRLLLNARLSLGQGLSLEADQDSFSIAPGGRATFAVRASNTGQDAVAFALSLRSTLPPGWQARFAGLGDPTAGPLSLMPGQQAVIPLEVDASAYATAQSLATLVLLAEGTSESQGVRDAISLAVTVAAVRGLTVEAPAPVPLVPASLTQIPITVRNGGNGPTEVRMLSALVPGAWNVTLPASRTLAAGETWSFSVALLVPSTQPAGAFTVALRLQESGGLPQEVKIPVLVLEKHALSWDMPLRELLAQPGDAGGVVLRVSNLGNVPEDVRVDVVGPAGWGAAAESATGPLQPGASRPVRLSWRVPVAAESAILSVAARTVSDPSVARADVKVDVEVPTLELATLQATGNAARAGDPVFVLGRFSNPSRVPLRNAEVRLMEGEVVIDAVRFDSVGPGQEIVALLRWTVSDPNAAVAAEWGTNSTDGFEPSGRQAVDAVTDPFVGRNAPTPVALAFVALVLAALAARRRA